MSPSECNQEKYSNNNKYFDGKNTKLQNIPCHPSLDCEL